jgi:hypothetical protein
MTLRVGVLEAYVVLQVLACFEDLGAASAENEVEFAKVDTSPFE